MASSRIPSISDIDTISMYCIVSNNMRTSATVLSEVITMDFLTHTLISSYPADKAYNLYNFGRIVGTWLPALGVSLLFEFAV